MASIIDLLQKLVSHEKSAREIGSIEEAHAFAAKVQTLLTDHKLTMSEVEFEAQELTNPMGQTAMKGSKRSRVWMLQLQQSVATNFFCNCFTNIKAGSFYFIGRETDRTAAVQMYLHLVRLGKVFSEKDCADYTNGLKVSAWIARNQGRYPKSVLDKALRSIRSGFKRSFLISYSVAIKNRLDATRSDINASADDHGRSMIARNMDSVNSYCAQRYRAPVLVRKARHGSEAGMEAGTTRGSQVPLSNSRSLELGA